MFCPATTYAELAFSACSGHLLCVFISALSYIISRLMNKLDLPIWMFMNDQSSGMRAGVTRESEHTQVALKKVLNRIRKSHHGDLRAYFELIRHQAEHDASAAARKSR